MHVPFSSSLLEVCLHADVARLKMYTGSRTNNPSIMFVPIRTAIPLTRGMFSAGTINRAGYALAIRYNVALMFLFVACYKDSLPVAFNNVQQSFSVSRTTNIIDNIDGVDLLK
jgi:hypothetical protein